MQVSLLNSGNLVHFGRSDAVQGQGCDGSEYRVGKTWRLWYGHTDSIYLCAYAHANLSELFYTHVLVRFLLL